MELRNILLVALGGALGSVCRYLLSKLSLGTFPWGTLTVNILGSLLIGLLTGLMLRGSVSPEMKLLLVTGFCGGFTTFSTFANESFGMMKAGDSNLYQTKNVLYPIESFTVDHTTAPNLAINIQPTTTTPGTAQAVANAELPATTLHSH